MTPEQRRQLSKFLSLHLRHTPERLGLTLQPGGWVNVGDLLRASLEHGVPITRDELREVVATSDKQRFSFDSDDTRIRAKQGHSVPIDLGLERATPPQVLYHGTGARSLAAIQREGLRRMDRHHVHLSGDVESAAHVGARHGRPVVLVVDAGTMHNEGHTFFRSDNGVWLVDSVPPNRLSVLDG